MVNKTQSNNSIKEIPLKITFPLKLKINKNTRFFIFFPSINDFTLSNGKNFENGFWSISYKELETTNIIQTSHAKDFQFLLIYKNSYKTEILSNIYYQNESLHSGPFISANYKVTEENKIDLEMSSLTNQDDTIFEIENVPETASLKNAKNISETLWEVSGKKASNVQLLFSNFNSMPDKISITITAHNKKDPKYKSSFNILIKLKDKPLNYPKHFRNLTIDIKKIIKESGIKFDKYILTIKNVPKYICIKDGCQISNKWIINPNDNQTLTLENFNTNKKLVDMTLEFITIKNKPHTIETYSKKVSCNFTNSKLEQKDFAKCITCKNCNKCELFDTFMDYIGNTTLLRHIISK